MKLTLLLTSYSMEISQVKQFGLCLTLPEILFFPPTSSFVLHMTTHYIMFTYLILLIILFKMIKMLLLLKEEDTQPVVKKLRLVYRPRPPEQSLNLSAALTSRDALQVVKVHFLI